MAIAHVRGGEEMGSFWYDNGRIFNKMNTFTDFIDCAQFLVNEGYTSLKQLVAWRQCWRVVDGRSDQYGRRTVQGSVHAAVPFVDVVSTMLDATIPLTTNEYDEWGNPNKQADYQYMLSYSPYDQVRAQVYPNLIVTTGLHDSQVQYWEPMKWVAKLRATKTDQNTLFLILKWRPVMALLVATNDTKNCVRLRFFMFMLDLDLSQWTQSTPSKQSHSDDNLFNQRDAP